MNTKTWATKIVTSLLGLALTVVAPWAAADKVGASQTAAHAAADRAAQAAREASSAQDSSTEADADNAAMAAEKAQLAKDKADLAAENARKKSKDHPEDATARDKAAKADDAAKAAKEKADEAEAKAKEAEQAADTAASKGDKAAKDAHAKFKKRRAFHRAMLKAYRAFQLAVWKMDTSSPKSQREQTDYQKDIDETIGWLSVAVWPPPAGATALAASGSGPLQFSIAGTGDTIGHVADLRITNTGNQPWQGTVTFPPMLTPLGGDRQPYALCPIQWPGPPYLPTNPFLPPILPPPAPLIPEPPQKLEWALYGPVRMPGITAPLLQLGLTGSLAVGETATIPMAGICLSSRLQPLGKGETGKARFASTTSPEEAQRWAETLHTVHQIIVAATQLQLAGAFNTPFTKDLAKELRTIIQWTVWFHNAAEEGKPITEDDFARKVYDQAAANAGGKLSAEQKEQLQPGIKQLWGAILLTDKHVMGTL